MVVGCLAAEDALRLINTGFHNRVTAATAMNAQSSRSHCVLTVSLERRGQRSGLTSVRTARLHLVDLAGNERLKTMEGAPGRIRETSAINTSLTVLGLVILRLTERQAHIPYRNSKLTFLLQVSSGSAWPHAMLSWRAAAAVRLGCMQQCRTR
jgi:kinesin family protein 15